MSAFSITIVMIVVLVLGVPFWCRSEPEFRSALPEVLIYGIQRVPGWAWISLLLLSTTATFIAIPLALIWTRSLTTGVKGGLSVGFTMTVILAMAAVTIRWNLAQKTPIASKLLYHSTINLT